MFDGVATTLEAAVVVICCHVPVFDATSLAASIRNSPAASRRQSATDAVASSRAARSSRRCQ